MYTDFLLFYCGVFLKEFSNVDSSEHTSDNDKMIRETVIKDDV